MNRFLIAFGAVVATLMLYSFALAKGNSPLDPLIVETDPTSPLHVQNGPGDSLNVTVDNSSIPVTPGGGNFPVTGNVGISGEVEVKNDSGNPLDVDGTVIVTNIQPIDVIERPGNANYTIRVNSPTINEFSSFEATLTIPTASHMQGLTVSSVARGNTTYCELKLKYPADAALRPVNQIDPEFMKVLLGVPVDSIHIPLADLFVGEGVELTYTFSTVGVGTGGDCRFTFVLQLRPLPGGLLP